MDDKSVMFILNIKGKEIRFHAQPSSDGSWRGELVHLVDGHGVERNLYTVWGCRDAADTVFNLANRAEEFV